MAINWSAYEAAKEIYGDNKDNIADIGSRFPLFARTVSMVNSEYLLDILKALPKVTARVVESGLKDMGVDETEVEEEVKEEAKEESKKESKKPARGKKAVKKEEPEDEWEDEEEEAEDAEKEEMDYESMTAKELYAECCKRGISSKCKDRKKTTLIKLLKETEGGSEEEASDDDWGDEDEEPKKEEKDPYKGKTAKELFVMCKKRGITAAQKKEASYYANLLKKADEAGAEDEE